MFETVTVSALKNLDPDVYSGQLTEALTALITVEDAAVRWTVDGTTPTTTVGHEVSAGGVINLATFVEIQKFKVINVSGTAKLSVTYDTSSSQAASAANVSGDINVDLIQTDVDALLAPHVSVIRKTSGLTAKATSSDSVVELIAADGSNDLYQVIIANEGSVAGFYSIDGGTTWHRLPSEHVTQINNVLISNKAIQMKRVASGSNVLDVYAEAF